MIQPSKELTDFNFVYKEMDDIYHDIARMLNLSDSAFNILYTICCMGDGCLQKDICSTTFISKQTINSSIKNLERSGFLTLEAGKGRDMHIHLTPLGKELAETTILPVIEMENQTFEELLPEERRLLIHLLQKYVVYLRKNTDLLFTEKK